MRIRLDRDTCIGMFQCVAEWESGFEPDRDAGKVDLVEAETVESGVFERQVPEDAELDARYAARACPVDAISIFEDDESP